LTKLIVDSDRGKFFFRRGKKCRKPNGFQGFLTKYEG